MRWQCRQRRRGSFWFDLALQDAVHDMYDVSNACGYASDIKEGALNDAVNSKR